MNYGNAFTRSTVTWASGCWIKQLLHNERFTIAGARKRMKSLPRDDHRQAQLPLVERTYRSLLVRIKKDIESLHRMLS